MDRARKYLAKIPSAVAGQGGHNQTYAAARAMVYGFDLGEAIAFDLLITDYNSRCSPPWAEKDLRHKIEDANSKPFDKLRGWLLNDDWSVNGDDVDLGQFATNALRTKSEVRNRAKITYRNLTSLADGFHSSIRRESLWV